MLVGVLVGLEVMVGDGVLLGDGVMVSQGVWLGAAVMALQIEVTVFSTDTSLA